MPVRTFKAHLLTHLIKLVHWDDDDHWIDTRFYDMVSPFYVSLPGGVVKNVFYMLLKG